MPTPRETYLFRRHYRDAAQSVCRRSGSTLLFVIGALALVALVVGIGLYYLAGDRDAASLKPLLTEVEQGAFDHIVLEQGEVESSDNVEIRCEIRARSGSTGPSTSIIDVVPEGTVVKEGDWLVTFDSSSLELERRSQQIAVDTSEAAKIQAEAALWTALIALREYYDAGDTDIDIDTGADVMAQADLAIKIADRALATESVEEEQGKGVYFELKKTIENEKFVAEENLTRAKLSMESVERLAARGLVGLLQLKGEQFRVDAAENELALANQKLEVLGRYTKRKTLTELKSAIESARIALSSARSVYEEELTNLREIKDQIAKCTVNAPQAGQVVYANVQSSRSGSEFVVEAGAAVRERQVIIRLPDPKKMQVRAKISESRINLVSEGMPVSIRIDAFGDRTVLGEVTKVNRYAEPGNWWSSSGKEYVTLIAILEPPPELRVGLTAEVRIHVDHIENALQVPVQTVYERGGKTFALVENGDDWDTREIFISATNDKSVVVDPSGPESLKIGERVVLNPRKHLDKFDQSRFPAEDDESPPGAIPAELAADAAQRPIGAEDGESGKTAGSAKSNPMMERLDSDGDGKLVSDELPDGLRERLSAANADINGDGEYSAAELRSAMAKLRAAGGGPEGGPGGGGPGGGFGGGAPAGGAP